MFHRGLVQKLLTINIHLILLNDDIINVIVRIIPINELKTIYVLSKKVNFTQVQIT